MSTKANLATAHKFLRALETFDSTGLPDLFTEDAEQVEWPNMLKPTGDRRGVEGLVADFERGKAILRSQRYDVSAELASDDMVMLEYTWTGVLSVAVGKLQPGDEMRAHCALAMEFKDGRIHRQRNYDCFEAF